MEYLTLQDIPQRHCHSIHSHRMSHSAERPLGSMAGAVRQESSSSPIILPPPAAMHPSTPTLPFYDYAVAERRASMVGLEPPSLRHIELPEPCASVPVASPSAPSSRSSSLSSEHVLFRRTLNADMRGEERRSSPMRNSPPLQPGEQAFPGKLPSFDEFIQNTIPRTPPHTPSRRNESAEVSPRVRPQFDDVAWSESKRKRVDTLGDIYASRPSNASEYPPSDPRRMSSAVVDPALYQSQRQASAGPAPHHRPSLPFPALPPGAGHVRTHSTPHAQVHGHSTYQQTPPPPAHAMAPQPHYPHTQPHHQSQIAYETRRPSYYQEPLPPAQTYPYENHRDSYYARSSFAGPSSHAGFEGYPQAQYDVRFQQHVGLDHNAFNRKRRGNLPKEATNYLKAWFAENRASPYPTEDQKIDMCRDTGLSLNQVSNWFINARRRAPGKDQREREANSTQ